MRKRLITPTPQGASSPSEDWRDLDSAAVVEVTSEEKGYPVESALVSGETEGWRAADSGTQTIRLVFDVPPRIRAPGSCLKKPRQSAPKSSCCAGFPMADTCFEKLCASNGTSARQTQHARPRT